MKDDSGPNLGVAMINRHNFKDLTIIDSHGKIIYADVGNSRYFDTDSESMKGKYLSEIYGDIDETYPTLVAARSGQAAAFFQAELTTVRGIRLKKTGCAYPIYKGGKPVGALEFADFFYDKEHIREIERHSDHLIYRKNNTKYLLDDIITGSREMQEIKKRIEKYAITDSNVLIYGETGTGKELIAQALHNSSRRYSKKFISINCGAIPSTLIESIIFGTTKGSFTGAEDKKGLFEIADEGTIFLDEINSLDMLLQTKILRAIESKTIRRIGSNKEIKVNVRIIAATNEAPKQLIEEERMMKDFYYRLAVIYISLPRLAERGDDILILSDHFIRYFNEKMNCHIMPLDDEVKHLLLQYDWPGNVRELRNVIEGAIALTDNNFIGMEDIPAYIKSSCRQRSPRGNREEDINFEPGSLRKMKEGIEREIVTAAYKKTNGNIKETADLLGISKQLLEYKLTKYGR